MLRSAVFVSVLCAVVCHEEGGHADVKVVSVPKKLDGKVSYQEEVLPVKYPMFLPQPYPIYVEKRMPYREDADPRTYRNPYDGSQGFYEDKKTYSGVITTIGRGDEDRYGKEEVVQSPLIFAASHRSVIKRMPYPLKKYLSHEDKVPEAYPCPDHDFPHFGEEFYYPVKPPGNFGFKPDEKPSESDNRKSTDIHFGIKSEFEKPLLLPDRDLPVFSDSFPYGGEGSVQHREVFQGPILITEERPGYRFVKHLVGAGVLPVGRQFHVLILEEDVEEGKETSRDEGELHNDKRLTPEVQEDVSGGHSKDDEEEEHEDEEKLEEKKTVIIGEGEGKEDIDSKSNESGHSEGSEAGDDKSHSHESGTADSRGTPGPGWEEPENGSTNTSDDAEVVGGIDIKIKT